MPMIEKVIKEAPLGCILATRPALSMQAHLLKERLRIPSGL
jgi:hypothetical protein